MSENKPNQEKSFGVLMRREAANEVEKTIYSIKGLAKAIFYLSTDNNELDEDRLSALMELALTIEGGAEKIIGLTVAGDRVETVEIEGDRIRLAE